MRLAILTELGTMSESNDKSIERVFRRLPRKSNQRCYHVVGKTLLWVAALNLANRCFTQWSYFRLGAVDPGECGGSQAALPALGIVSILYFSVLVVVLHPNEARNSTLDGVT